MFLQKKSQADFAKNNCIRKSFLLQATFTMDAVAIFPKTISFPQYIYIYDREIKMYFYLAMVGFEPKPTSTAAPSNTETTVIPSRPLLPTNIYLRLTLYA